MNGQSQVKNTIKGDVPALFSNWYIITSSQYTSILGVTHRIFAIRDNTSSVESKKFLDVICQEDGTFTALGSSSYDETLQIINRLPNEAKKVSYFIKPKSQPGINQEYYDYLLALRTANRYLTSNF